jgi:hypothetical protein
MREQFGLAQLDHRGNAFERMEAPEQLLQHAWRRIGAERVLDGEQARLTAIMCSSASAK